MNLTVQVMTEGAHSGHSSGIVPSSFRICRELLSRIEDEKTGLVVPPEFNVEVPPSRLEQVKVTGEILGDELVRQFPFVEGAHPVAKDAPISEHVLARTWRPALSVTGCDGLPPSAVPATSPSACRRWRRPAGRRRRPPRSAPSGPASWPSSRCRPRCSPPRGPRAAQPRCSPCCPRRARWPGAAG